MERIRNGWHDDQERNPAKKLSHAWLGPLAVIGSHTTRVWLSNRSRGTYSANSVVGGKCFVSILPPPHVIRSHHNRKRLAQTNRFLSFRPIHPNVVARCRRWISEFVAVRIRDR
jgi:hypothetical protein